MDKQAHRGHHARMAFRFVHSADLHLDSPLRSLALRNEELAGLVAGAARTVLSRMVDLCLEEKVQALLLAGDLFDGRLRSMKTAAFFARQMQRLHEASIPVFIVRGNHDAASRLVQIMDLPANVRIFSPRGESHVLESANAALHGVSFGRNGAAKSLLPKFPAPSEGMINIGLLHTSLAGSNAHDEYAPCAPGELLDMGYDYWALGHIHKREIIAQKGCSIVMPGIPQGRHMNEDGPKSVSLVHIEHGGEARISEHFLAVAGFERLSLDLSAIDQWERMREAVREAIEARQKKLRAEIMIMRLELRGATALNARLRRNREYLAEEINIVAAEYGAVHCEKILVETSSGECGAGTEAGAKNSPRQGPLPELRAMARSTRLMNNITAGELTALLASLRSSLPPELRRQFEYEGRESEITAMAETGLEDVLARLEDEGQEKQCG